MDLRSWLNRHRISRMAGDSLLRILRRHGNDIPSSLTTLMHTPMRQELKAIGGGVYGHRPLRQTLTNLNINKEKKSSYSYVLTVSHYQSHRQWDGGLSLDE